jgi:hypothetical protein
MTNWGVETAWKTRVGCLYFFLFLFGVDGLSMAGEVRVRSVVWVEAKTARRRTTKR